MIIAVLSVKRSLKKYVFKEGTEIEFKFLNTAFMHRHKAAYIYTLKRAWELSLHDDLTLVVFTKNLLFVEKFSMNSLLSF